MNPKVLIIVVVVAFILFFVITQPQGSADFVLSILNILKNAANSVVLFLRSLF